jgi:hypothetical protein
MNTTLPSDRDLPPHAHARIRGRLELAVTERRRRPWLAPALSGLAALVLVAYFAWPGQHGARQPAGPTSPSSTESPAPTVPGVSPERRAQIEKACGEKVKDVIFDAGDSVLYQLIKDAAGEGALLYTADGRVTTCRPDDLDQPGSVYGASAGPLDYLPGPVSLDVTHDTTDGGDVVGGKYRGHPGVESYAGRATSDVARVTVTTSGATHQAVVVNGTFYVRILHPSDWQHPDPQPTVVVRAYDADGTLLAAVDMENGHAACMRLPDGQVKPEGSDPATCVPGVWWR